MTKSRLFISIVCMVLICSTSITSAVEWVEPSQYVVAGVIGASYENAQAPEWFPVAPSSWYFGGHYKTWVDFIASIDQKDFHWLNYGAGGDVSPNGMIHLNNLLTQAFTLNDQGQPVTTVKILVIGFWGNDFVWLPGYDQTVMDMLVQNVNDQIEVAKNAGVEKIIILGWPEYDDFDLDYFISLFPQLTDHIDESGYNQIKENYYNVFSQPNPDYLFVDPWCRFNTFDGVHPGESASKKAALIIRDAIHRYDKLVGKRNLFCH